MPISPSQAWNWITGHGSGEVAGAAALAEVFVHKFIRGARRNVETKVLDALRMGGSGSGWGLTDEQVASQHGWEPKKARSALKRLQRKGRVHQADGRWYIGGATIAPKPLSS